MKVITEKKKSKNKTTMIMKNMKKYNKMNQNWMTDQNQHKNQKR